MPDETQDDQETATPDNGITDADLQRHWITILAEYWRQADWEQFSGQQKSRAESFSERLEAAARSGSVHKMLKKLAHGLGMSAPNLPTAALDPLAAHDQQAMAVLRREKIYLVNKADETVQNYFNAKNNDDSNPEPTTSELTDFITDE